MPSLKRWYIDDDGAVLGDLYKEDGTNYGFFVVINAKIVKQNNGDLFVYDLRNPERVYRLEGKQVPITQVVT